MKKTLLDMARCPCTTLGCRFNRRLLWRHATAGDAPQMNPSQSLASFVSPFSFTFCSLRNSRRENLAGWTQTDCRLLLASWEGAGPKA